MLGWVLAQWGPSLQILIPSLNFCVEIQSTWALEFVEIDSESLCLGGYGLIGDRV